MAHYGLSRRLVGLSNLCEAYNLGALRIRIEPWGILQVKRRNVKESRNHVVVFQASLNPVPVPKTFGNLAGKHVELQVTAWGVELRAF